MSAAKDVLEGVQGRAHAPKPHRQGTDAGPRLVALLNRLRLVAMSCRTSARTTLFEACALIEPRTAHADQACAEALMRCLGEALGQRVRMLGPGTVEQSFDERWLMQLAGACARDDHASVQFLIRSRIAHPHRRLITFLVGRLSQGLT